MRSHSVWLRSIALPLFLFLFRFCLIVLWLYRYFAPPIVWIVLYRQTLKPLILRSMLHLSGGSHETFRQISPTPGTPGLTILTFKSRKNCQFVK
jgi:hypothetical protein